MYTCHSLLIFFFSPACFQRAAYCFDWTLAHSPLSFFTNYLIVIIHLHFLLPLLLHYHHVRRSWFITGGIKIFSIELSLNVLPTGSHEEIFFFFSKCILIAKIVKETLNHQICNHVLLFMTAWLLGIPVHLLSSNFRSGLTYSNFLVLVLAWWQTLVIAL